MNSGDALLQAVADTDERFEPTLDVAPGRASRLWVTSRHFAITYERVASPNPRPVRFLVIAADGDVVAGPFNPYNAVERACELAAGSTR